MALSAFEIFEIARLKPDLGLTSTVSNTGGTPAGQAAFQECRDGARELSCPGVRILLTVQERKMLLLAFGQQ